MALDLDSLLQPLDPLPASGPQNPPPRPRQPFWWHLGQFISAYLPLILMALLALATWWLVRNTPRPDEPREAAPLRHEPDYTMQGFTLQRFAADGALRVQVQGAQMRHYPDTDTLEIDEPMIRSTAAPSRSNLRKSSVSVNPNATTPSATERASGPFPVGKLHMLSRIARNHADAFSGPSTE
mgnify:CR=1 FL=1